MSAMHAVQPIASRSEGKIEPKHATAKTRLHVPHPSLGALHLPSFSAPAPFSAQARAARALRKGVESQKVAQPTVKSVPQTGAAHVDQVGASRVTYRDHVVVDATGEATAVHRTVTTVGRAAEKTGTVVNDMVQPGLLAVLFETEQQRTRRVNVQSVANTLILIGTLAERIAAHRK